MGKGSVQQEIQNLIDNILKDAEAEGFHFGKHAKRTIDAWYVVAELRRILLLDGVTVKEVIAQTEEDRDYEKLNMDYARVLNKLSEKLIG